MKRQHQTLLTQDRTDRIRWLRTVFKPIEYSLVFKFDIFGRIQRLIPAEILNKSTIAWKP